MRILSQPRSLFLSSLLFHFFDRSKALLRDRGQKREFQYRNKQQAQWRIYYLIFTFPYAIAVSLYINDNARRYFGQFIYSCAL